MESAHIAVVEDDPEIRTMVVALLGREGFRAKGFRTADAFDRAALHERFDLAVLDVMLPGEDGLSLCRRLRAAGDIGVLMVTARGDDVDRIVGLEIGADDYLAKPFNPRELVARARAILRRTQGAPGAGRIATPECYGFAGWRLDLGARTLDAPDGSAIELTGGEFDLLACFARHPQRVLNRDQLLDWTRGRLPGPFDRAVDVQVGRLRRKLAARGGDALIKTVRGGGYQFTATVERR